MSTKCFYCGPISVKECSKCKSLVEEHGLNCNAKVHICMDPCKICGNISTKICPKCSYLVVEHKPDCVNYHTCKARTEYQKSPYKDRLECPNCGNIGIETCLACGEQVGRHKDPKCTIPKHSCSKTGEEFFDCIYCGQINTARCETCGILYACHTSLTCNAHHNC